MARTKDADVVWFAVAVFGGTAAVSWFTAQPLWLRTVVVGVCVTAALGWWLLLGIPTTCAVTNRSNGRGCSNNVRGLLRACYRNDHKARKQKLLWAYVLRRSPRPPVDATAPPRTRWVPAGAAAAGTRPGGGYDVESGGYKATILVCTLVSTVFGVISGVAAFAQLLGVGAAGT